MASCRSQAAYLATCDVIDWQHPAVHQQAQALKQTLSGVAHDEAVARACFEFVRDEIAHSFDAQSGSATCSASDVLAHRTGFCYAKSHLLAALLRANGIPAALCYQRLRLDDDGAFCLHGLNAIYLPEHGWFRVDARGNKPGVNAQFNPKQEQLAFAIEHEGELDFPERHVTPRAEVVEVLTHSKDFSEVVRHLPDALA